jgi:chorismate dehydratase
MSPDATDRLTFAPTPYVNTAPLAHFLTSVDPRVRVIADHPSALAGRLLDGSADAATIPVIDLFDHPFRMVEGIGVCAEDEVQSVLLKCNRPLAEVRTVALDRASHTSNALSCILLRRHFGMEPEMSYADVDACDAAVVIGDRALCAPPAPGGDYDLAREWKAMTGLPFVFAVWAYRRDHPRAREITEIAHRAKEAGVAAIAELADREDRRLGLPAGRCRQYLESAVYYDVGPRELAAMELFQDLLRQYEPVLPPRDPPRPVAPRGRPS